MNRREIIALGVCLLGGGSAAWAGDEPMAPNVHVVSTAGKPVSVNAYRGEVVLIQFLFTDCVHCQRTAQMFTKLQRELGSKGLQVMGVAFNDPAKTEGTIETFIANNGVGFPVGYAERATVLQYLKFPMMGRFVVPQVMVVGRDGRLRAQSEPMGTPDLMDEQKLRGLLVKLLDESDPSRAAKVRK